VWPARSYAAETSGIRLSSLVPNFLSLPARNQAIIAQVQSAGLIEGAAKAHDDHPGRLLPRMASVDQTNGTSLVIKPQPSNGLR
jgi:hypothetical protein